MLNGTPRKISGLRGYPPQYRQLKARVGGHRVQPARSRLPREDSHSMNDLEKFFSRHEGRLLHKWHHYFEVYDRHFARLRGKPINIVEFGVSQGGSLQMWRHYFGERAVIHGVDINPKCKQFEEPGIHIFIGDQQDREFLRSIGRKIPSIDILIDDGGHTMEQQIATFEELFPRLSPNGVYLIEDLHTSYWKKWGGGYKKRKTFIEYSKNFIDQINAWHSHEPQRLSVSDFTKSVHSLHYYDSVLVIEKRPKAEPTHERKGEALFPDYAHQSPRVVDRLRRLMK
jgi:hypothetical protein